MVQKDPSDFNFQIGEYDRPEALLDDKPPEADVRSVSHRVTIITILIFCVLGLAVGIGYYHMRERFAEVHHTGAAGLENISQNLESRFSSLSIQQAKFQDTFSQQAEALEKRIETLKTELQGIEKQIASMGASKPNRKDLEQLVSKLNNNMTPGKQEVDRLASGQKQLLKSLEALDMKREKGLTHTASALEQNQERLAALQEELESLSARKIDKHIFNMQFKNEQKVYQKALDELTQKFEARIKRLEGKIRSTENTSIPRPPEPPGAASPSEKNVSGKPIKIEEQNIKQ